MEYTPWTLLTDFGLIGLLLLVGTVVRARVTLAQRLLLPASIIGGLLGLLFGPNVLGLLPFSEELGTYSSVLIVVVFATLPLLSAGGLSVGGYGRSVARFATSSIAMLALQMGLGILFTLLVLNLFWDLPTGFGVMLYAGWAGGFGTAAAMGSAFEAAGWTEASSLGFTSATVGALVGIASGVALVRWGVLRGRISSMGSLGALPASMRTGLLAGDEREPTGQATVSSSSVEPLVLHVGLIAAISAAAYALTSAAELLWPSVSLPTFSFAFLIGMLVRVTFGRTRAWRVVDPGTLKGISGSATDLTIVSGIASIVPGFVSGYALPLALLLLFGIAFCLVFFRYLAPRALGEQWFERGLYIYGWATASLSSSLALLRMVDPRLRSGTLEEAGLATLGSTPVEIALVTFAPILITAGLVWVLAGGWTLVGLAALAGAIALGTAGAARPATVSQDT